MIAEIGFSGHVDLAIGHADISMEVAKNYKKAISAAPQPSDDIIRDFIKTKREQLEEIYK